MTRAGLLRIASALALAGASAGAQAQINIDLGRIFGTVKNIGQAATDINEEQEANIGREYASLLVGAAPLVDRPDLQRYVNRVGRWLSLHSERPKLDWKFGVLDSGNINAFATPGGYVFVTKGLLARLHSEAELAGVLAHEIAHVVKKHHLSAIRKSAGLQAGANILAEYQSNRGRSSQASERMVSGAREVMLRGLDKNDEFEADRMGVVIATRSGYDPFGLPAVLQTLQSMNPQDSGLALMFSTHPAPGARLDELERVVATRLDRYAGQPQLAERFAGTLGGQ
ncbi:MAG TPA: M48 family metallopeptidase [Burkholderiales bacterium]|nr:M48 family metallopeptidase [Burkholderiales bacterium]